MTRRASFVLILGLLTAVSPLLHAEPVSAASGVDDYPARLKASPLDALVDPWQFYNRECTSFVAWRLNSENQVAFNDYWQGQHWGNASNWRNAANNLGIPVDNNPTRGSVAWWAAGSAGSSRGHVAWVQAVGDGAIVVEEYNYLRAGFYDTRTISSSSSLWPSGFIHIKDTQIRNTTSPTVTGTAQVGQKLVATRGTWSATHLTYSYQWLADGQPIAGATSKAFTPGAAQLGQQIRAKVTATKSGAHAGSAQSAQTENVAKGVFVNSSAPTVTGTAQVGVPIAANNGAWSAPGTFAYQWYAGGTAISGATTAGFTPTADQLGSGLKVRVSLSAPGYRTKRVSSAVTDAVAPGQFTVSTPPTVTGVAQVDHALTASAGSWSPVGSLSYQWLADGQPITGATTTTYTPTPEDLRKQISIQVTVKQRGYTDAVATSVATNGVAPGTFLNTREPAVTGIAQVGVELTADKGAWSPKASVSYQWVVNGTDVPGATSATFTPRPQDMGKKVTVEVSASRSGYLTATLPSASTATVLPGVMTNHQVPVITGTAVVGRTLSASDGAWSISPDAFGYQWYAGRTAIAGATDPTYQPTANDAGQAIHVVVTARSAGYTSLAASSLSTAKVVFGKVAFARPVIGGRAVVGRTLTARLADVAPSSATPHFRWYRDAQPIRGATGSTYVVQAGDLGHRLHLEVTMTATNWISRAERSATVSEVLTAPEVHARTTIQQGRALLHLTVVSPGLTTSQGVAKVWLGKRRVGVIDVAGGVGSGLLSAMAHGTHTLTIVYRAGPQEVVARRPLTITIP